MDISRGYASFKRFAICCGDQSNLILDINIFFKQKIVFNLFWSFWNFRSTIVMKICIDSPVSFFGHLVFDDKSLLTVLPLRPIRLPISLQENPYERYLLILSRSRRERCLNDFICIHYTVMQLEFELKPSAKRPGSHGIHLVSARKS